jgi:ADP-heptose:LPS heptosyltransferase
VNRKLLLFLDKSLFRALFYVVVVIAKLNRRRAEFPPKLSDPARFLVIRPGGLGDGLMSIPFLRVLKERFPTSHVTLVCVQKNRAILRHLPYHDELIVMDDLPRLFRNAWQLWRGRFDVLFDLEPFRRTSSIVGWISRARSRVGFDTNARRHLYTHLVTYSGDSCFEASNMLRQLSFLDIDVPSDRAADMSFPLPPDSRTAARAMLTEAGVDLDEDFLVAVAVGVLKPHHRWVISRFVALIELMRAEDKRTRVLLIGSAGDTEDVGAVLGGLKGQQRVVNLTGKTNVVDVLGVLQACRILIACDGGIVYMAAAVGCQTVSLWGPGVMERFKPPGEQHIGVRENYACIPCVTWDRLGEFPRCPYDRRCLNDIEATTVFGAYCRLKRRLEPIGEASAVSPLPR